MRLYTAGRVIVGDGRVLCNAGVLVDGDTIVDVGSFDTADRLDFPRGTLLPGLIDTHVHLAFGAGPDPVAELRAKSEPDLLLTMAGNAHALLSAGVTTARDLGAPHGLDLPVKRATANGTIRGPRLLSASRPLTPTGGHCWFLGGECDGEQALRAMIRRQHRDGADLVKVMATGAWRPQFTDAELAAIVDEAHGLGLPVAAHAHGVDGICRAVRAGVDALEHCTWQTQRGADGYRPEIADAIAAAGIAVCGTFSAASAADPACFEARVKVVADMRDRGVRFVAGSNAGLDHTPHRGFATGLITMSRYGFSPVEVIAAATSLAAESLGVPAGTLTAGNSADLLVVDGNPLLDLSALANPLLVVSRGRESRPEPADTILPHGPASQWFTN